MNVLLIGGGGREHALAWGLRQSAAIGELFCAPGNPGIAALARNVELDTSDRAELRMFLKDKDIGLVVIGPEAPLAAGVADTVRAEGVPAFGPGAQAARLEGSKVFAKQFMRRHGIPTADFLSFDNADRAIAYVSSSEWNPAFRVVKADGLAAGKGVYVCRGREEVLSAVRALMTESRLGDAGRNILIEEALDGEELSVICLCDGKTIRPLAPSQDHKRVFDNDEGPNTGGMGAYAPVPGVDDALRQALEERLFAPFLKGLAADGLDYRGVIYFGLMLTASGFRVLEFNVRFGDPETQVIVPLLDGDWLELFLSAAEGRLASSSIRLKNRAAACVVMASGGYPGEFKKGVRIEGLEKAGHREGVAVFHAGTRVAADGSIVTDGGRVLGVTGFGKDLDEALRRAYAAVRDIRFEGCHSRKDIGSRAVGRAVGA